VTCPGDATSPERGLGAIEDVSGALRQAREEYRALFEDAVEGIFRSTPDGRLLRANPALARMLGYPSGEEFMRSIRASAQDLHVDPERRALLIRELQRKGAVHGLESALRRRDGTVLWASISARAVRDPNGSVLHYDGFVTDVTSRRRAEEDARRIARVNRARTHCNQALIRATDEPALLRRICEIAVEEAGYRLCWAGRAEQDEARSVRPVAQAGFEEGYLDQLHVSWADVERGRGPTGTCIRTRRTVVAKSIASDPTMAPWREEALKRGYASSIAIPLLVDSGVYGALMIYAAEPEAFDAQEVELLTELAEDLAFGISTLRTRAERAKAEEALRSLNAELEQRVASRTAELALAREQEAELGFRIQRVLLLDRPPEDVRGIRVAAVTLPSERIDGDFYVFVNHENRTLDVILGDVMGKGVAAALLAAGTRSQFIRALAELADTCAAGALPELREVVMLAHAGLAPQLIELESFVTLCYARLDPNERRLELVDCGHTGVLHYHGATGACDARHGEDLPLGVRQGAIYDPIVVRFEPGDVFLLFSDGVTEARNPSGELFGVARLMDCVREGGRLAPAALLDSVRRAVLDFSRPRHLTDDLTMVALRVEELDSPRLLEELDIRSDLQQLGLVREFVRRCCRELPGGPLDETSTSELELAVDEAASNIMRHAYGGRSDQRIHVEAEGFPERVSVRLVHLGEPFVPPAAPPAVDGRRDSGFGTYLIARSVDDVRYERDERGRSRVVLVKWRRPWKGDHR
jgi:PAS domain S-box-containing protein